MKLRQIFNEVRLLLEKNYSGNNLNLDEGRFVIYFNFIKDRVQSYLLDKRSDDSIRLLSKYLVIEEPLREVDEENLYTTYSLPENYFDFSNVTIYASKGVCNDIQLLGNEVKSENKNILLTDIATKPSFFYRETLYLLSENGITVYKDEDFNLSGVELTYYKKIGEVDLAGYLRLDGTTSQDIDTDITDNLTPYFVNGIIKLFSVAQGDVNSYQITNNELFSPI